MAQGPQEPRYTFRMESATPLQGAIRFATENRLPLGVVLGPSDSLCGKVKTFALKNVPAAQVFDALLSGSDYSLSVEEGVWVVRPRKLPASSGYLLHLQFDSFGGGFKTTLQGLGIILAGNIRSRLRPGEGYIGDILSSPDAEKVDPFTLENVTVEQIANHIVSLAGKGAWVLYPVPDDRQQMGNTRHLYVYGYTDDAWALADLSCVNPGERRAK